MRPLRPAAAAAAALGLSLQAETASAQTEPPVRLDAVYIADLFAVVKGGLRRDEAFLGKLLVSLEADGSAVGLPGVTGFLSLQDVHGDGLSEELVGDAQVISNIEAGAAPWLFEAWIEAGLPGDAALKAGLIDLNSEFDVQSVGALFLNSSHGIGPEFSQTGLNGPSIFPTAAAAVMVRASAGGWTGRIGLFDPVAGDPDRPDRVSARLAGHDGALAVAEIERALGERATLRGGVWTYTSDLETIEETTPSGEPLADTGNRGAYATLEGVVWRGADSRTLDAWLRVGVADDRFNAIDTYVGGGFAWGDDDLRWGAAVAHARLGDPARRVARAAGEPLGAAETALELTVSKKITDWLTLQPDLQYVVDPSWRDDVDDALAVGVRAVLTAGFPR